LNRGRAKAATCREDWKNKASTPARCLLSNTAAAGCGVTRSIACAEYVKYTSALPSLVPCIRSASLFDTSHPAAIDAAIGKDGLKVVCLLRLSPLLPFGTLNYLCSSGGIFATLAASLVLTRIAKRALSTALRDAPASGAKGDKQSTP